MGVPKLFRYLVERYPLILSDADPLIQPNFDNLYVDLNGLIHTCSHGPTVDAFGNNTEEEILSLLCAALEKLVGIVQPKQLLYIAIDGVAPRAKMNQQRQRRFRVARDKSIKDKNAAEKPNKNKNNQVPEFDSNSITPGTTFMANLNAKLAKFIEHKLTTDRYWSTLRVVFSGVDIPGEGEHKIASFIRKRKTESDYDPNTTHCLYGLDADLIMLGLATHERFFSIIREKVVFRSQNDPLNERQTIQIQQTNDFQIISVSILREYIQAEFAGVEDSESVIDDFVVFCFFIGNDFIPALPLFEIDENGLSTIIEAYKSALPTWKNKYLTKNFQLEISNLRDLFGKLVEPENKRIKEIQKKLEQALTTALQPQPEKSAEKQENLNASSDTITPPTTPKQDKTKPTTTQEPAAPATTAAPKEKKAKKAKEPVANPLAQQPKSKTATTTTPAPSTSTSWGKPIAVTAGAPSTTQQPTPSTATPTPTTTQPTPQPKEKGQSSNEKQAESSLKSMLGVGQTTQATPTQTPTTTTSNPKSAEQQLKALLGIGKEGQAVQPQQQANVEAQLKRLLGIKPHEDEEAPVMSSLLSVLAAQTQAQAQQEKQAENAITTDKFKSSYYLTRFPTKKEEKEIDHALLDQVCVNYIEGLVWVFNYYYRGHLSWSWYYKYYTGPFVSDLARAEQKLFLNLQFTMSKPFTPLEQLISVLPPESSYLLPKEFQSLVTEKSSPIIEYFPREAELLLDPKNRSWKDIVLIPFVDEAKLIATVSKIEESKLTAAEKARNKFGKTLSYKFEKGNAVATEYSIEDGQTGKTTSTKVLEEKKSWPSIKSLPFETQLRKAGVTVVGSASRSDSLILKLNNKIPTDQHEAKIAEKLLRTTVYTEWPLKRDAQVVIVENQRYSYKLSEKGQLQTTPSTRKSWKDLASAMAEKYVTKRGVDVGIITWLVTINPFVGLTTKNNEIVRKFDTDRFETWPLQYVTGWGSQPNSSKFTEQSFPSIDLQFPVGSNVVWTGSAAKYYGFVGHVTQNDGKQVSVKLRLPTNPDNSQQWAAPYEKYFRLSEACLRYSVGPKTVSRLAGSVSLHNGSTRMDVGLGLKYSTRKLKVLGYARRGENDWELSSKAVELMNQFYAKFPELFAFVNMNLSRDSYDAKEIFVEKPVVVVAPKPAPTPAPTTDSTTSSTETPAPATETKVEETKPEEPKPVDPLAHLPYVDRRVTELLAFLNALPTAQMNLVGENVQALPDEELVKLETRIRNEYPKVQFEETIVVSTKPVTELLNVSNGIYGVIGQISRYQLGDRVTSIAETGPVPFGTRGVIVGLNDERDFAEVVFDREFPGGTTSRHRLQDLRASTVAVNKLLSISHPHIALGKAKDEKPKKEKKEGETTATTETTTTESTTTTTPTDQKAASKPAAKAQQPQQPKKKPSKKPSGGANVFDLLDDE